MYKVNDVIVYARGVCVIIDIGVPDFINSNDIYYKMTSLSDNNGITYLKVSNGNLPLRTVITRDEAEVLLASIPTMETQYIADDKMRDKEYNEILKACDCKQFLGIMKSIYKERVLRTEKGKKLGQIDDRNFHKIIKLLKSEFAVALNISQEQAEIKIKTAIMK